MHVKIVALLIKLIDWQYYAFQNTVDSRYCEHPRGVGWGGGGGGADLGSVIATVRNSGVREKKIVWEIFLTPFEKQNIPKFSVVIDLLIVFCEFYL